MVRLLTIHGFQMLMVLSVTVLFIIKCDYRLSAGYHNITVVATDNEDYSVTSSATMIRIKAVPVVNITSITPNAYPTGTSVSLAATATDNDGSIAAYQWRSDLDGIISTSKDFSITTLSAGYNITFQSKKMQTDIGHIKTMSIFDNIPRGKLELVYKVLDPR